MRRFFRRAAALLFVLVLLGGCLACANDKYDFRNASLTATADADALTLYEGGTLVTYTVTAPKQCVKITLQQHAGGLDDAGDPAILNEQTFTSDSEGVTVAEEGANAVWTIPCDFGDNGLDGVRVKAQIPMGKKADYLYADVAVRVAYPSYTPDTLSAAYENFVRLNADKPYWFTVAPGDEALVKEGLAALSGAQSIVTDADFLVPASGAPVIETAAASGDIEGMFVPEGSVLVKLYIPNDDYTLCHEGEGLRVADSARAILMAAAGEAPDAALYPVAALLYEKAQGILADLPMDGLGDYEKLTELYERVYNEGRMALTPDDFDALPEAERSYYDDTAYGLMSGFGGASRGYADALYLLCRMAGLSCEKLTCEQLGGEKDYCVNAVELDGAWYIVDAFAAEETDLFARFCLSGAQAEELYALEDFAFTLSDSTEFNVKPAEAGPAETEPAP